MEPARHQLGRPAVGIVAGIQDVLAINRKPQTGKGIERIVCLEHPLRPVVELPVAEEVADETPKAKRKKAPAPSFDEAAAATKAKKSTSGDEE